MSVVADSSPTGNRILDRLSESEYKSLVGSAKYVSISSGDEVYRQDGLDSQLHVYFPTSGMISLSVIMENGKKVQAATIGNEGMIGLSVALGLDSSPTRAISHISGRGLRIQAVAFLTAMNPGGTLELLMRRYTSYSLQYANQMAACNLLHSVEQRLCRWLLMSHDRVDSDEFSLTHEYLAEMLGVRRQSVTVIAGALQKSGVLTYRRGVIQVLNRAKLEAASCECYGVTRACYDRIMI